MNTTKGLKYISTLLVLAVSRTSVTAQPVSGIADGLRMFMLGDQTSRLGQQENPQSIQVIGAGLPRTGTGSLQTALTSLGFHTYHMKKILEDSSHSALWAAVARGEETMDNAFAKIGQVGFNATLDYPTSDMIEDQLRLYPDAKVIISVRDNAAAWARSIVTLQRLMEATERPFSWKFPNFLPILFPKWHADVQAIRCNMGTRALGWESCAFMKPSMWKEPAWLEEQYEKQLSYVKARVPEDRLLIFNVKEGWEPLCKFLEVPVPNVPFPHVGDSAMLKRGYVVFHVLVYSWIPLLMILVLLMYTLCVVKKTPSSKVKQG